MGSQPNLQSLREFQRATSGGLFRGREELEALDYALSQLQEYGPTMSSSDRMAMLQFAIKSAQQWLRSKQTKLDSNATSLVRKRAAAVQKLLSELGDNYRFESFLANKALGRVDQTRGMELKGLSGNYIFEATAQPKGVAHPSASDVMSYAQAQGLSVGSKESYTQARDQYVADDARGGKLEQIYYNRAARMRHLLLMQKGKLWTDPSTPANLAGPYAMDEYGNLFAQESPENDPRAFNHSSFCRGKQVVCAGIIGVRDGVVTNINNMSGHYKPGPNQLANALRILVANGLDLTQTMVMCALGPGGDDNRHLCRFHTSVDVCRNDPLAFMKVVIALTPGFLNNPSGRGLTVVHSGTIKSAAEAKFWETNPHVVYAHMS